MGKCRYSSSAYSLTIVKSEIRVPNNLIFWLNPLYIEIPELNYSGIKIGFDLKDLQLSEAYRPFGHLLNIY